jgi:Glycosyl-transferase for dystroglycan
MKVTVAKGISPMDRYPINLLRNLAIRSVSTSHFAYTDSDFLISEGLYEELIATAPWVMKDPFAALVLPAFAYFSHCPKSISNSIESIECLEREGFAPCQGRSTIPLEQASTGLAQCQGWFSWEAFPWQYPV